MYTLRLALIRGRRRRQGRFVLMCLFVWTVFAAFASIANGETARSLAVGDFSSINQVLQGTTFQLPSMSRTEGSTTLRLTQIICRNVNVGDIEIQDEITLSQELIVRIVDLDLICQARYRYSGRLLSGDGDVTVTSRNNDVTVRGEVLTGSTSSEPPSGVTMKVCNPSVNINEIDFDNGGFLGWVLNLVEGLARGIMENLVEDLLCQELEQALANGQEMLQELNAKLLSYPVDLVVDPLNAEQAYLESSSEALGDDLLDLANPQTTIGQWTNQVLEEGIEYLQRSVTAEGADSPDLQANLWIRDWLNEDRGLVVLDPEVDEPWALLYNHDVLLETTIQLRRVQILGLDTLATLNPLEITGKYTLQSEVAWDFLSLDLDVTMDIQPSSLDEAIVDGDGGLTEEFHVVVGLSEIRASLAMLAAIRQDLLESLQVGSLLTKANLLPCLVSTLAQLEFSGFTIEAGDIFSPVVSPFESVGLYRILGQLVDIVFKLYETVVLERAPAVFQQDFRQLLNDQLETFLNTARTGEGSDAVCPLPSLSVDTNAPASFVDFRDLLLDPFEAWWRGGTGSEPYGDLIPSLITPNLESQLMTADLFNSRLIGSATKAQSGEAGTFHWPEVVLMDWSAKEASSLYDAAVLHVSNPRIFNLDTVQEPLSILDPQDWNSLYQTISWTSNERPLNLTTSVLLAIGDELSPLAMANHMDISIEVPSIAMELGFLAHMKETDLLRFPLVDATNPYCWLSTLGPYVEQLEGAESMSLQPIVLETLGLALSTFRLSATCIACTSPGVAVLSAILQDDLPAAGFQDVFTDRLLRLVEAIVETFWESLDIDVVMSDAKARCPHKAGSDPTVLSTERQTDFAWPKSKDFFLREISSESMDTLLGLGVVAVQAAVTVGALNHLSLEKVGDAEANDEAYFVAVDPGVESSILDWTNLSASMGGWADFAFEEFRQYLLTPANDTTTDARLVQLLKDYVLDKDGAFVIEMPIEDVPFEDSGFEVSGLQIVVVGIDSISDLDILSPTQPQILRNNLVMDNLSISVEATVKIGNQTEVLKLMYSVKNLVIDFDILFAVNLSMIQATKIGSIFEIDDIAACFASGIEDVEITTISASIGDLEGPVFSGMFDSEFQDAIKSIVGQLARTYHNDTVAAFPLFLDTSLKRILNRLIPEALQSLQQACPAPAYYPAETNVDFRELLLSVDESVLLGGEGKTPYGNLFQELYQLLVDNVLRTGASNQPVINDIFRHLTVTHSNTTGALVIEKSVFDTNTRIKIAGLDAMIAFKVSGVSIENLDSVGHPLEVAKPLPGEANILSNIISFGVDSKPLRLGASFGLSVSDGADMNIQNDLRLDLTLESVSILADILLRISERSFAQFPIGDLDNVNCWLATILSQPPENDLAFRGIGLEQQSFQIGNFSLNVDCTECSSPDFDKLLLSLYDFNNVTELEDTIRDQTEGVFDTEFFPAFLDQVVDGAARRCPHNDKYDPNAEPLSFLSSPASSLGFLHLESDTTNPAYFLAVNTAIAVVLFAVGVLAWLATSKRNKKWIESLDREGEILFRRQQKKEKEMQAMLDSTTTSLYSYPYIPRRVRYGVPLGILLNTGLYLGGHLGVLSVVNIDAAVAGEEFSINQFLEFKFIESTRNTYLNGGAEMAVLLWIFTGIWPYVKLVGSLLVWMLPPKYLSVKRRGQVLLWIDALAKLSVIDIFTMLLGFAVLLVFIGGPDEELSYSETTLYAFKAIIVPRAGFYCLIIAQRMSRVSSKFLLEYHNLLIEVATKTHKKGKDDSCSRSSSFSDPSDDLSEYSESAHTNEDTPQELDDETSTATSDAPEDKKQQKKEYRWGTIGVVLGACTIFVIFVIGCIYAPAISLDTSSLAGLAAESGLTYEEVVNKYGVFLVMSSLLVQARFVLDTKADYIGLGLLLFVGLASAAFVFFMQVYQFVKRKLRERKEGRKEPTYGHRGCGLPFYLRLYKWRHMEIYLISVAVGVWQLGSACSYAIYLYCDVLRQLYSVLEFVGLMEESSAQCSRIQASLPANLIIIAGSFALLLGAFIFQALAQYKKNITDALRYVDEEDVPSLSLAWSSDRSKNSRYSHMSVTVSMDEFSDELQTVPSTPSTTASSIPGTPFRDSSSEDDDESQDTPRAVSPPPIQPALEHSPVFATPTRPTPIGRRVRSVRFQDVESDDGSDQPPSPPVVNRGSSPERPVLLGYRQSNVNPRNQHGQMI